jgi:hypothetical protein
MGKNLQASGGRKGAGAGQEENLRRRVPFPGEFF